VKKSDHLLPIFGFKGALPLDQASHLVRVRDKANFTGVSDHDLAIPTTGGEDHRYEQ
jgi:hypothetical protein